MLMINSNRKISLLIIINLTAVVLLSIVTIIFVTATSDSTIDVESILFLVFIILFQSIPFIINYFLIKKFGGRNFLGAIVTTVVLILGYILVYYDVMTSTSSTAAISIIFAPVFLILIIPIGYLTGWLKNKIFGSKP